MVFDPKYARERFRMMTREEVLEEVALRTDEYVPQALALLEEEARSRGITPEQIEARRGGAAAPPPGPEEELDEPALITSAMERGDVEQVAEFLRRKGVPAAVHEIDTRRFHGSGCAVGRWGLFVPGSMAAEVGRKLEALFAAEAGAAAPGCGGGCAGGSCGPGGESAAIEPGEWDEDGDWWKTGAPGEDDP